MVIQGHPFCVNTVTVLPIAHFFVKLRNVKSKGVKKWIKRKNIPKREITKRAIEECAEELFYKYIHHTRVLALKGCNSVKIIELLEKNAEIGIPNSKRKRLLQG